MPSIFSRLKGRDGKSKSKKNANLGLADQAPKKPRWEDAWTRTTVEPDEVQDLIRRCTEELKARALDHPFLLLPFRPTSDPSAVRTFVRHFFDGNQVLRGEALSQELRMTEPMVISGVVKWCWSRLQGGVVGWDSYEWFKIGEQDSNLARDSFKTFIPMSVEVESRSAIIFDFFDLLSAIAAHGKTNGFGGRKLSRMASWWAFELKETPGGFETGYQAWTKAADATSHLFFAYLRSLAPQSSVGGISMLPMSLQKLLQETEYPPQRPSLMQSTTNRVVMIVDTVSPTPFALLRRANHFDYRDDDKALKEWSEYEDPIQALTEECRRVLRAVSAANQSQAVSSSKHSTSLRDASWSRFEDIGFASALEEEEEDDEAKQPASRNTNGLRSTPASGNGLGRPTTPSWADFLSSGFVDDGPNHPSNLLLPPDKILPPIETAVRQRSSQSHRPRLESDRQLEPGELASITRFELDDAFWWVWMSSLAPEETQERKSAFGRCAVIETVIRAGRWLVMEEMVKGAAPEPDPGAYIAEKKSFFSWTRRGKGISRRKSTGKHALDKSETGLKASSSIGLSKTSIGPDQHAKIQAAAARLQARQNEERKLQPQAVDARGRVNVGHEKTNSVFTLQPVIMSEASPAMKWATKYDKEAIREAYLSDSTAGRGQKPQADGPPSSAAAPTSNGFGHPPPEVPSSHAADPQPQPQPQPQSQSSPAAAEPAPPAAPEPKHSHLIRKAVPESKKEPRPVEQSAVPTSPKPPATPEPVRTVVSPEPELSPESKKQQKRLQKEKEKPAIQNTSGFRKLFGRNKSRNSKVPDDAPSRLKEMGLKEEKDAPLKPTTPDPQSEKPVATEQPKDKAKEPTQAAPTKKAEDNTPKPVSPEPPASEPILEAAPSSHTRQHSSGDVEPKDAEAEFARFDQGPLEQPAFVPDESDDDDAVPPPIARHPSRSPIPSPKAAPAEPETPKQAGVQDRWAQIRKNAADRANQRPSEDWSGGQSKTTDGDDDTSGEETIESRVARIKARVAELTAGAEGTRPPLRR